LQHKTSMLLCRSQKLHIWIVNTKGISNSIPIFWAPKPIWVEREGLGTKNLHCLLQHTQIWIPICICAYTNIGPICHQSLFFPHLELSSATADGLVTSHGARAWCTKTAKGMAGRTSVGIMRNRAGARAVINLENWQTNNENE
jgi:hypothetical protein